MADTALPPRRWPKPDTAWALVILSLIAVALLDAPHLPDVLRMTANALLGTAPFILFAVTAVATLKATGAETLIARAFDGPPLRMIVLAAVIGGLSPFCSCEVIPFIAAMLALGVPLSAVMAFWLASPVMDPAMFIITSSALGWEFAMAKTFAAIAIGIGAGIVTLLAAHTAVFADPLRDVAKPQGCCSGPAQPFSGSPHWTFWDSPERRQSFNQTFTSNLGLLVKWLTLAYVFEALMVLYLPAGLIASYVGGSGAMPIVMGALVGAPAYLNGYAAPALVSGLLDQGMAPGAAMSFMIAGGISCVPAAIAVWALVKPRVFGAYIGFAMVGAVAAGLGWSLWSATI